MSYISRRDFFNGIALTIAGGPVPAYLTAQLANYQAALARLGPTIHHRRSFAPVGGPLVGSR